VSARPCGSASAVPDSSPNVMSTQANAAQGRILMARAGAFRAE
jgi:hypothetical protein